jgi:rod shape-determining protein MreD
MIREIIKYVIMYLVLVLIQVLFLNQVQFSGYINPYIYLLFVMLLPLNSPRYVVLFSAFFIGLTIDVFTNTLGIHSASTVLIAFIRPFVVRAISNREEDRTEYPSLAYNKFSWFLYYTAVMVVIHHFFLFYLEVFTFHQFLETFYRVILSSVFSIFVIVLSQFLIFRK